MLRRIRSASALALILSPVGLILLAATRVLIVSDYNLTTALAVVSSSGYVNTLFGSVLPLVPVLMPYIALVLLYFERMIAALLAFAAALLISPATKSSAKAAWLVRHDLHLMVGGSGVRQAGLILVSIPFAVSLIIEIAGFRFATILRTAGTAGIIAVYPLIVTLYPVPVSGGFYENILSQPWLPAENVTLSTHIVVTGYVLSSNEDWFEMLLDKNRVVVQYPASDVVARDLCQAPVSASARPLIPVAPLAEQPLPACGSG